METVTCDNSPYGHNSPANTSDTIIKGKTLHFIPLNPLTIVPCESANVFCTGNAYTFPSGSTGTSPPPVNNYPNYGCLGIAFGPAWYYMQVGVAGDIIITISQTMPPPNQTVQLDVDFVCWGPFTSVSDACATGLTSANIVDCSISPWSIETCHILNAQLGKIYILLMSNFSETPGIITFSQSGGSGQTNCNPVVHCSVISMTANPSSCNSLTNTFSVTGNMEFTNPPSAGTLTVSDNTAVPPITQVFSPPFTSPKAYSLSNIPCDGLVHSVTASFSASAACTFVQQYTSPPSSCPSAVISGGGTICNDGISLASVSINISGSPPPYTFTYAINGISQIPVSNYGGSLPYLIHTAVPGSYTLVSVTNQACPSGGTVSGSAMVTLNPLPTATVAGTATVCKNSASPPVTFTGASATAPYTFTYNLNGGASQFVTTSRGNSVSIAAPTGTTGAFTYTLLGVQDASSTACSQSQSGSATITVNPGPYVNLTACNDPKTTTTSRAFTLKGGVPPGGQYYIDGIPAAGGLFDPSALTASTHQLTYSVVGSNGCTSTSAEVPISVISGSGSGTCPGNFTDPRDEQVYKAVQLGGHCWMGTNLNYGTKMDFSSQAQSDNCEPEKYCLPSDAGCSANGGFYQWDELMQYQVPLPGQKLQGLCPPEWHVPSQSEWQELINAVASRNPGDGIAGGFLKDSIPVFGLHALIDGIFYLNNFWAFTSGDPRVTMFWTSTTIGPYHAVARGMNSYNYSVSFYPSLRANAFPIRCLKD